MKTLMSSEQFSPKDEGHPWKKSDTDRMLDLLLSGMHPNRIAEKMNRSSKAINRQIERFADNEKGRCEKYEPQRRISRKGNRWTQNDAELTRRMRAKGVKDKNIAKVLARDEVEMASTEGKSFHQDVKRVVMIADLVEAYQYLYHVSHHPVVSDKVYDAMKEEEDHFGVKNEHDGKPGRKKPAEYSPAVRDLACYLFSKHLRENKKLMEDYDEDVACP